MRSRSYPSDVTDEQWGLIEPHLPVYPGGRPRVTDMRAVVDAIFYLLRSGAFTGSGELVGEGWKWKEWKSVTKLAGGVGTVASEDKLTAQGLTATKTFTGADGKVVARIEDVLAPVRQKTYEILHARLAPEVKK